MRLLCLVLILCNAASESHSLGFVLLPLRTTTTRTTTTYSSQATVRPRQRQRQGTRKHATVAKTGISLSRRSFGGSNGQAEYDDDNDDHPSASALFPKAASYVPSGLTADQYRQIKREEALRLSRLNLGAWGPKFLRNGSAAGPPRGDWMVMPTLWTHGYDSRSFADAAGSSNYNRGESALAGLMRVQRRLIRSCRANGPAFVLALVATETIMSIVRWAVARVVAQSHLSSPLSSVSAVLSRAGIAAAVAAAAAPRIRARYLENWSRKLLWSQRRLWCATVAALSVAWLLAARCL